MRKSNYDAVTSAIDYARTCQTNLAIDAKGNYVSIDNGLDCVIYNLEKVLENESCDIQFSDLQNNTFFRYDKSAMSTVYLRVTNKYVLRFSNGKLTDECCDTLQHNVVELKDYELTVVPKKDETPF